MVRNIPSFTGSSLAHVFDHLSDRSGAVLVKIAARLEDRDLAKKALDTLFSMERKTASQTSFPVESPDDVFLSRIYFEGQREKIAADQAAAIEERLDIYETLHGVNTVVSFTTPELPKTAQAEYELLPLCKIASSAELIQSGNDFFQDFLQLPVKDRITFAENFRKAAAELSVDVPEVVDLFTPDRVEVRPDLSEQVLLRKVAMDRAGEYENGYAVLYDSLREFNAKEASTEELCKLAEALEYADKAYALHSRKSGKSIPDAWHSVFQVKHAEDSKEEDSVKDVTQDKASLVSRYGMGILEEVEDDDGNIDKERVKDVLSRLGLSEEK